METMIDALVEEIATLTANLRKTIEDADQASLDWRPGPDTSSLTVLATHGLGSLEFLVATALGKSIPRDRDAEFASQGLNKEALLTRLDEVAARVKGWLENTDIATLAQMRQTRLREQSGALCVVHAAAHFAEHLGHAQLTYQLWSLAHRQAK